MVKDMDYYDLETRIKELEQKVDIILESKLIFVERGLDFLLERIEKLEKNN